MAQITDPSTWEIINVPDAPKSSGVHFITEPTFSEKTNDLFKALMKAEEKMPVMRTDAEFGAIMNNKKYKKAETLLSEVKKVLRKEWVFVFFTTGQSFLDNKWDKMTYIVSLLGRAVHVDSGQWMEVCIPAMKMDKKDVSLYSSLTIGKKNLIKAIVHIETDDDPEAEDYTQTEKETTVEKIEAKQLVEKKAETKKPAPETVAKKKVTPKKKPAPVIEAVENAEEVFETKAEEGFESNTKTEKDMPKMIRNLEIMKKKIDADPAQLEVVIGLIKKAKTQVIKDNEKELIKILKEYANKK